MGKRMPYTSLAFTIGAFSIVGLPPFIGFPGKFMIVKAALLKQDIMFTVLIFLILMATIIEGAYFFRVVQAIYFKGEKNAPGQKRETAPLSVLIPVFIFVGLIVVIGIYPKLITDILNSSASELLNRSDYIKNILP